MSRSRFSIHSAVALLIAACLCLSTLPALSRPFTVQDAGHEIVSIRQEYVINADGTLNSEWAATYRVLTEEGVRGFNVYNVSYNANTQRVTLKKIEVKNGDEVITIDPQNVEEKSLFGGHSGYDETKTKIIPLPKIRIGSEVSIAYSHEIFHPAFPNTISTRVGLAQGQPVGSFFIRIDVPAGTNTALHDPGKLFAPYYRETESAGRKIMTVEVQNLPGIGTVNENDAFTAKNDMAWIDVSNKTSFEDAAQTAAIGFEKVLKEPLPERLIALFGAKPQTPLAKDDAAKRLLAVLQAIADNFRYFGDWRSVDGGFVPRPLKDIAETGYGDCKDFSVLVASAARHLGLEASSALVFRGENPEPAAPVIPSLDLYNHAIARVKIPGEENYWWLDATNPVPNLGVIPFDIAGRHALVLSGPPGEAQIPRDPPEKSTQDITITMDPSLSPDNHYKAQIRFDGHVAWQIKKLLLGKSPREIEEYMTGFLGVSLYDARDVKMHKADFSQNLPHAVVFDFELKEKSGIWRSGDLKLLPVMTFGDAHLRVLGVNPEDRRTDLNLMNLRKVTVTQQFARGSYSEVVGLPKSCRIESPWLEYTREVTAEPELKVRDVYRVPVYRAGLDEIRSSEFKKLQDALKDCVKGIRAAVR